MPRAKDAKIWNEDLVQALDARHQKAHREGKRDVHLWRTGRDKILAVRKDIYQFRTGSIVNLPNDLSKRVQRLCEDVIRGVKSVYPDGHVPTNSNSAEGSTGIAQSHPATPILAPSINNTCSGTKNPFDNYNYMKNMKIRSGAFAILMAFRYSITEILTKRDICREAQKFCDNEMEANWHAGRPQGAWNGIKTLKNHKLVNEQGHASYTPNGFRDRPHSYSLTRDGDLFIDALLANRPEALDAAIKAAGSDPRRPFSRGIGVPMGTSDISQRNGYVSLESTPLVSSNKSKNIYDDKVELEEWIATASVGDRKEFKVGKDRRKKLHDLCDAMQKRQPGLRLTHGSSGISRSRTLSIQLVSKPNSSHYMTPASSINNPNSRSHLSSVNHQEAKQLFPPSKLSQNARKMAGLAAIQRQEKTKEDIDLRAAIMESKKMSVSQSSKKLAMKGAKRQQHNRSTGGDEDEELREAIRASMLEIQTPPTVKRNIFAVDDSSDDDLPPPIFSPSPIQKKRKLNMNEEDKKPAAKNLSEVCFIGSSSGKVRYGQRERLTLPLNDTVGQKKPSAKRQRKELRAVTSEGLKWTDTPGSIDLCESSDDEKMHDIIEISERIEEPIDLSNSQLSQDHIDLSIGRLSQDPNCVEVSSVHGDIDNDVVIVLDDATNQVEPISTLSELSVPEKQHPEKDNRHLMLTVLIDNRERNRNATPRTLRTELTRHLKSGPLSNIWPAGLPLAHVEESSLKWGDIQYMVQNGSNFDHSTRRLGVSIERKRVNDLVQRSSDGDHLIQLFRMKQHCSLSLLLIENDTRTARNVTPYNAQHKEGFDPLDPTITCEDDIYRMFGRILLSSDCIKFIQTRDEQASLRAIGALGLMAIFAPPKFTKELKAKENIGDTAKGTQALSDKLKQAGIPWRIAKRIAGVVGGPIELKALYESCCSEAAKSQLLSHIINTGDDEDQGGLKSSAIGWSDAVYRIISALPHSSSNNAMKLTGETALLLHKELIEDHGQYLSSLYQGCSPEEALEKVLDNPVSSSSTRQALVSRYLTIFLTSNQATKFFTPTRSDERTFYKLSIITDDISKRQSGAITMRAQSGSLVSKSLLVFEMDGSTIVDLVRDSCIAGQGSNYVSIAKAVANRVDSLCCSQHQGLSSHAKRILMICGLQPALDANAKKPGYTTETKTVVDMVFAELLLCHDMTILQALLKTPSDRVNLVKQLALACFHCGLTTHKLDDT